MAGKLLIDPLSSTVSFHNSKIFIYFLGKIHEFMCDYSVNLYIMGSVQLSLNSDLVPDV